MFNWDIASNKVRNQALGTEECSALFDQEKKMRDNRFSVDFDERTVDVIFSSFDQCQLPGGVVGIALHGRPVYRKGFGLASIEQNTVLAPTTRMRLASISKHFVCAAYMILCDQGKADIDASIDTYLPEINPASSRATMRQLMSNTSCLRDVHDICYQFSGIDARVSSTELLGMYRTIADVNAAAGSTWMYNNGAYLLISAAIERITDRSLEEVLRDQIFESVHMYDTALHRWGTEFVANCAQSHAASSAGGFEKVVLGAAFAGEGGVVSTVDDMLRWLAHMDHPVVGSALTWKTMRSPQRLSNGVCTDYAMGLVIDQYRGIDVLSHTGGFPGVSAYMVKVPSVGLDVVVMLNRDDVLAMSFVDNILDACVTGLDPIKQNAGNVEVNGIFVSRTTGRVVQLHSRAGCQMASIDGGEDVPFSYDRDGEFRASGTWRFMDRAIVIGECTNGSHSIHLREFGSSEELIPSEPLHTASIEQIEGNYQSSATGVRAQIYPCDGIYRLCTSGAFGSVSFRLVPIAEDVWRMVPLLYGPSWLGGVLVFDKDGAEFRFSTPRNRALVFQRSYFGRRAN